MFLLDRLHSKLNIPKAENALPGRENAVDPGENHFVNGNSLKAPYPQGCETVLLGMGCFWGAERIFWEMQDMQVTAAGYAAGHTKNPTYQEVCTGLTGHNEVVLAVFDPEKISFARILKMFWESHDPTQGMRQGNDRGTQYRSGIYCSTEAQLTVAISSKEDFQTALSGAGKGIITTEIMAAPEFYFAEEYHQQYLAKNPSGYCGLGGTGVTCPIPTSVSD